jgi:hypothetical protein
MILREMCLKKDVDAQGERKCLCTGCTSVHVAVKDVDAQGVRKCLCTGCT